MFKYEFRDLHESPRYSRGLETEFGGTNLDHEFRDFFTTLNVTGRGLIAPNVSTTERTGAAGVWIDSAELPAREITVEALIEHDNARKAFNELNAELNKYGTEPQKLVFNDEGEYFFNAVYQGFEEPKEDKDSLIVTLKFLCPDPFKYGRQEELKGTGEIRFNRNYLWPAKLEEIEVSGHMSEKVHLALDKTGQHLTLNGEDEIQLSGKTLLIDILKREIKAGNFNALRLLSLDSDFENIYLPPGCTVRVTPSTANVKLRFRERVL